MLDDPLGALEAELVGAARRMAVELSPAPAGLRRLRLSLGAVAAALATALALVVGAGTVVLLGHHGGSRGTGKLAETTTTAVSLPLALEGRIGALIGTADVGPADMARTQSVSRQLGFGRYSSFSSTAGEVKVPGGVRIELWELAARPSGKPAVDLLAAVVGGRVVARATAAQALARGLVFVYGYSASGTRVAVVVPDEVTRVRLLVPGTRPMLAAVHHNVAAFEVAGFRLVRIAAGARVVWYGRDGRVIRRK